MMADIEALITKFEDLIHFVRNANAGLADNKIVNTEKLNRDVEHLMQSVQHLNAKDAQKIKPLMAQLIQELDELAQDIENSGEIT